MKLREQGVTLVELAITVAVLAIMVTLAAPSFAEFRERQALRGVADNIVAAVALAKEEAVKRDAWVRVDFKQFGDSACVGARVVANAAATTANGCDCTVADSSQAGFCPLARFPDRRNDLRSVQLSAGSIQFGPSGADTGFVIDPKTATVANLSPGGLQLATQRGYQAAVRINALARPVVCTPNGATKTLPGVASC